MAMIENLLSTTWHILDVFGSMVILGITITLGLGMFSFLSKFTPIRKAIASGYFALIDEIQAKQTAEREAIKQDIKSHDKRIAQTEQDVSILTTKLETFSKEQETHMNMTQALIEMMKGK